MERRMPTAEKDIRVSVDDYLKQEKKSNIKNEYMSGYIYAMAGASRIHNLIAGAIFSTIRSGSRSSGCRTYMSDMKLHAKIGNDDVFYYPDLMVSCDKSPPSEYYENNPIFIVEVLSESTEPKDRLEKLGVYTNLQSLREYMLVAQNKVAVDVYRKIGGSWILNTYAEEDDIILDSINISISMKEIYEDVLGMIR
jgi:Uma2 family endonuclease